MCTAINSKLRMQLFDWSLSCDCDCHYESWLFNLLIVNRHSDCRCEGWLVDLLIVDLLINQLRSLRIDIPNWRLKYSLMVAMMMSFDSTLSHDFGRKPRDYPKHAQVLLFSVSVD